MQHTDKLSELLYTEWIFNEHALIFHFQNSLFDKRTLGMPSFTVF